MLKYDWLFYPKILILKKLTRYIVFFLRIIILIPKLVHYDSYVTPRLAYIPNVIFKQVSQKKFILM